MAHYGSLVEANAFFDSRLHSYDWDIATPSDREKALTQATELIDQFDYLGQKYAVSILPEDATEEECRLAELSQPLEFPRGTVNEVPVQIEHACYLIAKALLAGRDPEMDLESLANRSASYGDVRVTYNRDGNLLEHMGHLIPSPQAWNLLKPFLREKYQFNMKRT